MKALGGADAPGAGGLVKRREDALEGVVRVHGASPQWRRPASADREPDCRTTAPFPMVLLEQAERAEPAPNERRPRSPAAAARLKLCRNRIEPPYFKNKGIAQNEG